MNQKFGCLALLLLFMYLVSFTSCKPEDTIPPSLILLPDHNTTLYMYLPAVKGGAPTFADPGFTATDNNVDISNKVKVYGQVNPNLKGRYVLTYSVKDAAGNISTATRTVYVINNADSLAGIYTVTDTTMSSPSVINSYAASIRSDNYVNNHIYFGNFGGIYGDSLVPGIINDSKTYITIPTDTATKLGSGQDIHVFSGGGPDSVGNLIPTVIKLSWTDQPISPPSPKTLHNSVWKH